MKWEEGLERLERIAEAAAEARVAVVRVEERGFRAEVRREGASVAREAGPPPEAGAAGLPHATLNGRSGAPVTMLRSDLVGIVRLARPLVPVGAEVEGDDDLAFVESLGIRTPVRAGEGGVVAEILVEDGQAVDYGQALFALTPGT
jgi:acetyl-CoA carboxylase biotin carboxyl carrier protein